MKERIEEPLQIEEPAGELIQFPASGIYAEQATRVQPMACRRYEIMDWRFPQ